MANKSQPQAVETPVNPVAVLLTKLEEAVNAATRAEADLNAAKDVLAEKTLAYNKAMDAALSAQSEIQERIGSLLPQQGRVRIA